MSTFSHLIAKVTTTETHTPSVSCIHNLSFLVVALVDTRPHSWPLIMEWKSRWSKPNLAWEERACCGDVSLLRRCWHVARVISEVSEMGEWGVDFGSPQVTVDKLRERKEKVISTLSGGLSNLAKQRKVKVINARGTFVDSGKLKLEGSEESELTFDHCIIATGSIPTKIPAFDIGSDRVMDSTGALELKDAPETMLVVGGGYIGLEMATVYASLGTKVSVVELTPGLLPGADRDLVRPLQKRLEKGVLGNIYLETKVLGLAEAGDKIEVKMAGGDGEFSEQYDRVLVSIGRRPNTANLGLENTKVKVTDRGFIEHDEQMRTADPKLLVIGDAAGEPMLAHKATHEGKVAAEALLGQPAAFDKMAIPAVVFTDPEIAWTGITEEEAKQAGREVEVNRYPWLASGRAVVAGADRRFDQDDCRSGNRPRSGGRDCRN